MKVLLLSAYAARSHRHWRQQLLELFPQWQWQVLELPPRHFSWRIRGNPLYWSVEERATLEQDYDLVLATSMVDLATLRGLVPSLAACRTLLYFHENQFSYPPGKGKASALEAQMVSLYSAMSADGLLFNSTFNQQTFLAGCQALLAKLPDYIPEGVVAALTEKSGVLPVPIQTPSSAGTSAVWPGAQRPGQSIIRIAWLGRFEYDKGPDRLLNTLYALEAAELQYELAVIGQQFRVLPDAFETVKREFSHRLVHLGFLESDEVFVGMLGEADIALSTALHEFQGLALIEAAAAGAIPVVPARQAYPDVFPAEYLYDSNPDDPQVEALSAASKIVSVSACIMQKTIAAPDVSRFYSENLVAGYAEQLSSFGKTG